MTKRVYNKQIKTSENFAKNLLERVKMSLEAEMQFVSQLSDRIIVIGKREHTEDKIIEVPTIRISLSKDGKSTIIALKNVKAQRVPEIRCEGVEVFEAFNDVAVNYFMSFNEEAYLDNLFLLD